MPTKQLPGHFGSGLVGFFLLLASGFAYVLTLIASKI